MSQLRQHRAGESAGPPNSPALNSEDRGGVPRGCTYLTPIGFETRSQESITAAAQKGSAMTRIPLSEDAIDRCVPHSPGAYQLVAANRVIYVGRSDEDLNTRLKDHLAHRETNPCIRGHGPTEVIFEATRTAYEAYVLELAWYRTYRPTCNVAEPRRPAA